MPSQSSLRLRLQVYAPNRYLLAISALLIVMAVSVAMAVIYPYQDLNAQNIAAAAAVVVDSSSSSVGGVGMSSGVGSGAGVLDDDASSVSSGVSVGGSAVTQSNVDGEGIITQATDEATAKPNNELMENNESSVVSNNAGGESLIESVAGVSSATPIITEKLLTTDDVKAEESGIDEQQSLISSTSNASNNDDNSNPAANSTTTTAQQQDDNHSLFDKENTPTPTSSPTGLISPPTMAVIASPTAPIVLTEETTALSSTNTTENNIQQQQQQECHSLLQQANVDSPNNMMDPSEYVTFVTNLQKKLTHSADDVVEGEEGIGNHEYTDLPQELKMNFVHLSCVCPATNANCCADRNGIYIGDGINGGNTMEEDGNSRISVTKICAQTLTAMGDLVDEWE